MNIACSATIAHHPNGTKLFEKFDLQQYTMLSSEYDLLSKDQKALYKGKEDFITKKTGITLSALNRNYGKLSDEINERINSMDVPELLNIDYVVDDRTVINLLTSIENEDYIKDLYKGKKLKVVSGLNTGEATILMECMKQGRSLLEAGQGADILAKPLIDFYAATAYAYALIVINSPLHKSISSLKGSHGHTYNHLNGTVDFGGDIPSGTFLDMLCAFPVAQIHAENTDIKYSVLDSIDLVQNNSISLSLTTLLSMVPELTDFYKRIDKEHQVVHKLAIDTSVVNSKISYNFYIGNGISKPDKEKLKSCFKTEQIKDNQGSYIVSINSEQLHYVSPIIYQDLRGTLWYIETP